MKYTPLLRPKRSSETDVSPQSDPQVQSFYALDIISHTCFPASPGGKKMEGSIVGLVMMVSISLKLRGKAILVGIPP
jgi:hypothetical protein